MILYMLTTEGGSREDGNVYYAEHILVDAPESAREKLNATIAELLGLDSTLMFEAFKNDEADELFGKPERLAEALRERAWAARVVAPEIIVQDQGY